MTVYNCRRLRLLAVVMLATCVLVPAAQADNDDHDEKRHSEKHNGKYGGENRGKPLQPVQTNALFQQECSTCHIAYAPGLLPAESWRKVMNGLDKHFGSDASLSEQDNKEITAFLVKNASNRWTAPTSPLRIGDAEWFKRKHDEHEINPAIWKKPQVKSPANCAACHLQADRNDYSERNIRMPR